MPENPVAGPRAFGDLSIGPSAPFFDTPLKQFVVAHANMVRHCRAIHDAVMKPV